MKPIKRSYAAGKKKYRSSLVGNKSVGLLQKTKTDKSKHGKFQPKKPQNKKVTSRGKVQSVPNDVATSLRYFFSPVEISPSDDGVAANGNFPKISTTLGDQDPTTTADLRNMIFIVLDSLEESRDCQQHSRPSVRNVKPSPRKVSTRRKGNIKKKPAFSESFPTADKKFTKKNKTLNLGSVTSKTRKASRDDGKVMSLRVTGKKSFRQQAAGDSEKKDVKHVKPTNPKAECCGDDDYDGDDDDDKNKYERIDSELKESVEDRRLIMAYENISKTFLDICLPFTFAGQAPPEEEISKIDGKFIRSLMKIAKVEKETEARKNKIRRSGKEENKSDGSGCEDQNAEIQVTKVRKTKNNDGIKSTKKPKKRLHQTQNVFFVPDIDGIKSAETPFCTLQPPEIKVEADAEKNNLLQTSMSRKTKFNRLNLSEIKSEKLKGKSATKSGEKNRKTLAKASKRNDIDIPLNDDGSKVTEIWRNEARVSSDNSLTSHSSTSVTDKTESVYPPDFEMKSYRALQKIVEEEVQRIYKSHQQTESNVEEEKSENGSSELEKGDPKTLVHSQESTPALEPPSDPKRTEAKPYLKLTIPATKNVYDMYNSQGKGREDEKISCPNDETKEKRDKLDQIKMKLNSLAQETNANTGKIPEDIIKNWSIIRRLEKAFLALGTPAFPNKNSKNSISAVSQTRTKDSKRRNYQSDKTLRRKIRSGNNNNNNNNNSNTYSDYPLKSQIPVLASSRYDNRTGYDRTDRNQKTKRISRTDDFGKSDIYFFSFEPTCHQRKKTAWNEPKKSLEGFEGRKLDKNTANEGEPARGGIKTRTVEDDRQPINDVKTIPPPIQWLTTMNGADKSLARLPPKPKPHVLETKFLRKAQKQFPRNPSTHTIFPASDNNNPHILLKRSSSRTYVINSDDDDIDADVNNEQITSLERKETFDVIPAKNFALMKSISYTKTSEDKPQMNLKSEITQKGSTTDFKGNKSKTSMDREALKRSQSPVQLHKNPNSRRTIGSFEKVTHLDRYEGDRKPSREIPQPNFLVKQTKKLICQQSEVEKILIPWDVEAQLSKISDVPSGQSDEEKFQCHVNESTLTVPIDKTNEPFKILISKDFELETTSQNQSYDSSISTNTYDVSDGGVLKPLSCHSSISRMSTGTFNVIPVRREAKRKTERCPWEQDIKQYREIVKDIMSQYRRTNGLLKQSQQIAVQADSRNFGSNKDPTMNERSRHFAGHLTNIAEYRRKIMSEYNAVPLVDYKSRILEEKQGQVKVNDSFQRNLLVAKNVSEDIDSDVKDYHPNVHKILDTQLYVDTKNIGKRIKANGKFAQKAISLQDTVRLKENVCDGKEMRRTTGSQSLRQMETLSFPATQKEPEMNDVLGEASAINSLTSVSDCQSVQLHGGSSLS